MCRILIFLSFGKKKSHDLINTKRKKTDRPHSRSFNVICWAFFVHEKWFHIAAVIWCWYCFRYIFECVHNERSRMEGMPWHDTAREFQTMRKENDEQWKIENVFLCFVAFSFSSYRCWNITWETRSTVRTLYNQPKYQSKIFEWQHRQERKKIVCIS